VRLQLHPTEITGFQAQLAAKSAHRIAARMQELSTQLGTRSRWSDETNVLEIPLDS
jgi:poly-gamma-glutamate synthesis protein (capsule biosynthesis protein)